MIPPPGRRWFVLAVFCLIACFAAARVEAEIASPTPASAAFDRLHAAAVDWAELRSKDIHRAGRPLTAAETAMARKVGVREPERIRIMEVDVIPLPDIDAWKATLQQSGMAADGVLGLTLGHGVYLKKRAKVDVRAHEFRHVAQYECLGGIRPFMFCYLKELLHFGYGKGPLEHDAELAAKQQSH